MLCLALLLAIGMGAARAADQTVVIGGSGQSDIMVNYDAIDEALGKTKKPAKKSSIAKPKSKPKTVAKQATQPKPVAKAEPMKEPPVVKAEAAKPVPEPPPVPESAKEMAEAMVAAEPEAAPVPAPAEAKTKTAMAEAEKPAMAKPAPEPAAPPPPSELKAEPPREKPVAVPEPPPQPEATEMAMAEKAAEPEAAAPAADKSAETAETAAQTEIAMAVPEEPVSIASDLIRIPFAPNGAELPKSAVQPLDELAAQLSRDPSLRLQLLAFAAGTKETASQSRRLSLNRALAVRGALIDAGVRSTRIDVRALGSQTDESPADRVDVRVVKRGA